MVINALFNYDVCGRFKSIKRMIQIHIKPSLPDAFCLKLTQVGEIDLNKRGRAITLGLGFGSNYRCATILCEPNNGLPQASILTLT